MEPYLDATANYLYGWGSDYASVTKPMYTRRMRKIKVFITGT